VQHSPPDSFLCAVMQVLWAVAHDSQHVLPSGHRSRLGVSSASLWSLLLSAPPAGHSTQPRHVVQPLNKTIKNKMDELQKGLFMMNGRRQPELRLSFGADL
jgi:hypothetical protein